MGLKLTITIDGARHIDIGIWKAKLEPDELATLGQCDNRSGPFSVLLLESEVDFNAGSRTLTFDPSATQLLNVGNTDQVLVLSSNDSRPVAASDAHNTAPMPESEPAAPESAPDAPAKPNVVETGDPSPDLNQSLATGDKLFLSELPSGIRDLGEALLTEIRRLFPGELNYEPRAAKFDETPEIFWTVKILPHEKALRLTVRGIPESFEQTAGIDLKLDKFGYSAFLITRPSQVPGAIAIIKQARKNME